MNASTPENGPALTRAEALEVRRALDTLREIAPTVARTERAEMIIANLVDSIARAQQLGRRRPAPVSTDWRRRTVRRRAGRSICQPIR